MIGLLVLVVVPLVVSAGRFVAVSDERDAVRHNFFDDRAVSSSLAERCAPMLERMADASKSARDERGNSFTRAGAINDTHGDVVRHVDQCVLQ